MKWPVTFELRPDYKYDRETQTATMIRRTWHAFLHYDYYRGDEEAGRGANGETPSEALRNLFPNDMKDDDGKAPAILD